jgi:Spy/CpxP family protein refolding chaperone
VSPWKVILATMVIFACGVITGAMLTRTMVPRTEPAALAVLPAPTRASAPPMLQMQRANFLKVMDKQLDLSAEQREQIGKIMKASQERTQPLWNQIAPQMNAELKNVREEIRGVLTPEQRKKFVELLKRNRKADSAPPGPARPLRSNESTTFATNAL